MKKEILIPKKSLPPVFINPEHLPNIPENPIYFGSMQTVERNESPAGMDRKILCKTFRLVR